MSVDLSAGSFIEFMTIVVPAILISFLVVYQGDVRWKQEKPRLLFHAMKVFVICCASWLLIAIVTVLVR